MRNGSESTTAVQSSGHTPGAVADDRRRRLEQLLRKKAERSRSFPLSFSQQRLWLLDQLEPGDPLYNIPMAIRLSGAIDVDALNRTLHEVVARHETLRTRMDQGDDGPVQIVEPMQLREIAIVDLTHVAADDREAEAIARVNEEVRKPFRLDRAPLFRAVLLRLAATEHVLVVVLHHIISDDWSMGVLFREMAMLYRAFSLGQPSPLEKLPIQYADYAVWQRQQLQGERLDRALDYWRQRLRDVAMLELPTDRPRTAEIGNSGGTETMVLPPELAAGLREVARRDGATLYMILLAAFQTLLHRYSGQEDIAVGSPIAGRLGKETEGLIGFFVNSLVMRADMAGNPTFRDLLRQVRQTAMEAIEHQELPFERLVEAINPDRDTGRHPLFQASFSLQNAPWPDVKLVDLALSAIPINTGTAKFELSFETREDRHGLSVTAEYNSHLFRPDTIGRMLRHFQVLLEGIVADADRPISQLPLLTETERHQLLVEWNQTQTDYPKREGLHQFFEDRAAAAPDAVAAVFEGQSLTYGQLNARANRLARHLQRRGVGPETLVGLCMERSIEMVVAILGVMKAGGAYVPLDPDYPRERLDFIVADSRPAVLLTTSDLSDRISAGDWQTVCLDAEQEGIAGESDANLPCQTNADNAIYVIYTSGSTGLPKGTINIHRGLCNKILWEIEFLGLDATDRVLFKTPLSFDVSVVELFRGLLCGGGIVIARPGGHRDPGYLAELIGAEGVTTVEFVPAMLRAFLEDEHIARCGSLRSVTSGGEALTPELVQRFFERLDIPLFNMYGPTECSIGISGYPCRRDDRFESVPIGRPAANVRLYILDGQQNPVPIGVPGELYIGGVAVGRGYLNRPELNAERFIADPFSSTDGGLSQFSPQRKWDCPLPDRSADRLYKTGDCCRYLADGNIEFLGRRDQQVKIRGFRIELGEIEAVLQQDANVRDAIVIARESTPGNKRLAAYVVPQPGAEIAREELFALLRGRLPEYMVPAALVVMEALPLLPSGKIDRRALPAVEEKRPELASIYVAPRNDPERQLAEIWQEVLHVDRVGIHDNFFALGGHSLLATQVVSRIATRMHIEVPLRDMFQTPTVEGLARRAVAAVAGGKASREPIAVVPRDGTLLPSLNQEALWFLDQLERDRPTYTVYPTMRLRGPLDVPVLERALNEILRRHESLRTRLPEVDGRPTTVIEPVTFQPLEVVDLSELPAEEQDLACERHIAQESARPVNLRTGPLVRVKLLRLSAEEHVLAAAAHHIIYDGWSLAVLTRELTLLYHAYQAGEPSPLPELPIQYADFAAWQRQRLQGETLVELQEYWTKQLANVPPLELPTDYPRPAIRTTRGDTLPCNLSPELSAAVREFCAREGVTPFMTLLAAFELLLARYTGQEDFAIGSPVANRTQPETEPLIGYFINMVVLRGDLSGDPDFRSLVRQVSQTALGAYEHQDLTLDRVVDAVAPARDPSRHPLFQAMFVLQNNEPASLDDLGLKVEPFAEKPMQSAFFELTLALGESEQGFEGSLNFNIDLFRAGTIERMVRHFRTLLAEAIADPSRSLSTLPLLDEDERRTLLVDWNATDADSPRDACAADLFEAQAQATPEAVALVDGPRQWTYRELDQRANQLAHYLRSCGVGPDRIVAVRLPRSAELITALWGVLKAGGGYLPLDPQLPAERLRFTLEDAQAEVVVTLDRLRGDLPEGARHVICMDTDQAAIERCSMEPPVRETASHHLAYIIYTSGSTGRPKGVMIEHRALVNYAEAAAREYGITVADRVLQFASVSYDAHVEEVYPTLTRGATLVLRSDDMLDCRTFWQKCDAWAISFVTVPSAFWHELTDATRTEGLSVPETLRALVIGGEAAMPERVANWFDYVGNRVRVFNTYGPTETTVVATGAELSRAEGRMERVPIGRPLANMRAYVLDGSRRPVPIGVRGELYIGGESVGRGYLNRPELTTERFVPDPFSKESGARMYKTGDVVRWRADGRLDFIGRTDHQVKIRGFRIEPGEVEQVLREHPLLTDAAVVAGERSPGDLQLVAYTVGRDGESPSATEMRQFLRERLPEFMIPTAYVALDVLPQTTSGKIDRRGLPAPEWSSESRGGEFVAPRSPVEEQLAAIWSEVLNVEKVGANDDFFNLGGNSLLALRLTSRVRSGLSIDMPLVTIFAAPTLGEMAERIVALQTTERRPELPPIVSVPRDRPLPASFAQEPFWFVQQISPSATILNMHGALPITGALDVDVLRKTINEVVRRHESLRTTFTMSDSGELLQVLAPSLTIDLPVEDVSHLPPDERAEQTRRLALEQASQAFDLAREPPFRLRLLRLSDTEHVLLVCAHHVIADGWSLDVLATEVAQIYDAFRDGRPSPLPDLTVQYADYAAWQRNYMQGEVLDSLLGYWRTKLDGLASLELPTDRPRRVGVQHAQRAHTFQLPHRLKVRLNRLCSSAGVTPYMLFLAAFQALLHRYTDANDIAVGSPSANRQQPETHNMIGVFINTLVMRNDFSGDPSFRELLARVSQTAIEAYEHQEMRFERLAKELAPGHDLTKQPLVQILFSYHQPTSSQRLARRRELTVGFQETHLALQAAEVFDLTMAVADADQGFSGQVAYDETLFDDETITKLTAHYQSLLEAVASDPDQRLSQLPLLSDEERRQVLVEWNENESTSQSAEPGCVHQLFEAWAQRQPDAVALSCDGQTMSYGELDARANRLARYLQRRNVRPEVLVGICLEPSLEMAVAMLGVLKAGGAYVPLDPGDPRERIDFFLADSRPAVVLTTTALADRFSDTDARIMRLDAHCEYIAYEDETAPPCEATPDSAVFVLYTSGSTGTPKGAVNVHRGVANYLLWKRANLPLQPDDRVLLTTPISFDTSVEEFFGGLISGGCVVIAKPGSQREPRYLVELMAHEGITTACFVPSMLRMLLEEDDVERCTSLRRVVSGGEALTPDLMERFFRRLNADLYNDYGPTEASIAVTTWKCRRDYPRAIVPIGRPLSNVRVYILDQRQQPVPVGVPGELYIGGVAVGRGYLNRPELTAESFIEDPLGRGLSQFSPQRKWDCPLPSEPLRLYRTGDRARWLPDGNIEFLGRRDAQVKIHGSRIELGEVEAAISRHPGVAQAAVVARQPAEGGKYLAAYVVPRDGGIDGEESRATFVKDLRHFLQSSLPEYVIPQAFEIMEALPQLPSGKINRSELPASAPSARAPQRYVAPRTDVERELAAIWAEVLRVERVGAYDNFFELGGHSLLALRLTSRVRNVFSADLPLITLFAAPTLAEMAERIMEIQASGRSTELPPIQPVPRDGPLPMSYGQEALWLVSQLQDGPSPYVMFPAARLRGDLNVTALDRALNEVVRRHESLRTTFADVDGRGVQVISPHTVQELAVVDLSELPSEEREKEARRYLISQSQRPIDLTKGPLARVELLKLAADEHVVLIGMHHIIYDDWSIGVLARDLLAAYRAFVAEMPSPLPELPIQYADFAVWQRERLQGEVLETLQQYWLEQLDGLPTLELPTDRPRPSVRTTAGAATSCRLSASLSRAIAQLSRQEGATVFMTLMAAFETLLHRYSGQEDFGVGTPVAGRLRPETEDLIGYFVNTLVLRANLAGDPSFRETLARVRQTSLEAFDHQELPFERLVQEINPPRDLSRHPIVQVMFDMQNAPDDEERLPELRLSGVEMPRREIAADFDLALIVNEYEEGINLSLGYRTELFDEPTAARMLRHLQSLLEGAVADPELRLSQLPLLTEQERQHILVDWNQTDANFPEQTCLDELVESQVERTPDAVAAVCEEKTLLYRDLNQRANRLAHWLRNHGVKPDDLVALHVERSLDVVVGMLGILKAGGAFLPLDAELPSERIEYMMADANAPVLVTQQGLVDKLRKGVTLDGSTSPLAVCLDTDWDSIAQESGENPTRVTRPENLAYAIYTSGSTGKPKGVLIEHRSVVNVVTSFMRSYTVSPGDRVLQSASISFDVAINEVFPALCTGAAVVLPNRQQRLDVDGLADFVRRSAVTITAAAPTVLARLNQLPDPLPGVRLVLSGGEALSYGEVDRLRRTAEVINGYGPTEATICATSFAVPHQASDSRAVVPIGKPLANYKVYIVDAHLNCAAIGCPGELCIGGVGLARGYLNDPELTSGKFTVNPFVPGQRMYRTGDLARWLPDGNIAFLGRIDRQVKIRGHRIELGEVESVLASHPAIEKAAAVDWRVAEGDQRLVAYVVLRREQSAESGDERTQLLRGIKDFLAGKLPHYMLPSALIPIESLPLTSNGKIDRRALPAPTFSDMRAQYVAPRTPMEERLAAIWREVLGLQQVGIDANFFELGGHSLLAVRAMVRARETLGVRLPVATMFAAPTIAEMAERIEAARRGEAIDETEESPREGNAMQMVEEIAASLVGKSAHDGQSLAPLRTGGAARPLFCIHGLGGHVAAFFPLARGLAQERPVYGVQAQGLDAGQQPHDRIEDMAAFYLDEVRRVQPRGPYLLAGWSMGGVIALEMANQLTAVGEKVDLLAMFDTYLSIPEYERLDLEEQSVIRWIAPQLNIPPDELKKLSLEEQWQRIAEAADLADGIGVAEIRRLAAVCKAHLAACAIYRPKAFQGRAVLFRADGQHGAFDRRWKKVCPALKAEDAAGDHYSMLRKPNVDGLAQRLDEYLAAADANVVGTLRVPQPADGTRSVPATERHT